jgi:hypothetical protein
VPQNIQLFIIEAKLFHRNCNKFFKCIFYIGLIFIDLQLDAFKPLLLAMPLTIKLSNSV